MDESFVVEITTQGNAGVVAFQTASLSEVDKITAISEKVADFIEKSRPVRLIFDFKQVKFFSSQVLGMLVDMRSRLAAHDGEVIISAINPQLHRVFRITNLDKIFRFFPAIESAVKTNDTKSEE